MMRKRLPIYISVIIALLTAGCDEVVKSPKLGNKKITPDTFDEITTSPVASLPAPTLKRPTIKPKMYDAAFYKEVSLSIAEHVPVTSLLPALAKSIGVDLQLDPGVETVMFFQATNRPFIEVIEDLCDMGNMRYIIKDKRIRIERDQPYSHTYAIQFLNLTRNSQNRISVATNIFNNGHNSPASNDAGAVSTSMDSNFSGTDSANGSDSQLNVHNHNDFWSELETNLTLILKNSDDEALEPAEPAHAESSSHEPPPKSAHLKPVPFKAERSPTEYKEISDLKRGKGPEVILKKTKTHSSTKATAKPKAIPHKPKSYFSIHKQGGLLTVFATQKIQRRVSAYLEQLKIAASSQVLIEAKIIEVTLNHEFKSGINWARLNGRRGLQLQASFADMSKNTMHADPTQGAQNLFSIGAVGSNFSGILNLLEEFGSAKTLSSPRLTVMNNQAAILKVAQNQVYFRLNYDKQNPNNLTPGGSSVSSTIQTIPIGLIMAVQPSINLETGEVILFLRPTISKFSKIVSDPAVNIAYNANLSTGGDNLPAPSSTVPVVEVREIDSVMKLQDGEIGILGGLMEVSAHEDTDDIPGISEIPVIKDMFGARNKGEKVVELVILFKVRVERGGQTSVDAADMRLQDDYIADPRKWKH